MFEPNQIKHHLQVRTATADKLYLEILKIDKDSILSSALDMVNT